MYKIFKTAFKYFINKCCVHEVTTGFQIPFMNNNCVVKLCFNNTFADFVINYFVKANYFLLRQQTADTIFMTAAQLNGCIKPFIDGKTNCSSSLACWSAMILISILLLFLRLRGKWREEEMSIRYKYYFINRSYDFERRDHFLIFSVQNYNE